MPIARSVVFLILLFSVIYPVIWQFLPIAFSRLLGVAGIIYALFAMRSVYVIKVYKDIVFCYLFLIFLAFFQSTVNNNMDIEFVKHVLLIPILNLFAGYLLYAIIGKDGKSFGRLCDFLLFAAVIQAILSLVMFLSPDFSNQVQSMIVYNSGTEEKLETLTHRMVGIGQYFWGAGINYGIDLLILIILPDVNGSFINKYKLLYWPIAALIILAGILSARTFFVVFIFLILYFILMKKNIIKMILNSYKYILVIPIFIFFYQFIQSNLGTLRFSEVESFVFEVFKNYEETGEMESKSTNRLEEMYEVLPSTTKTWIIGDGKFINEDGSYYMRTDIGYSRHIFFYGLMGLVTFIFVLFFIYKTCAHQYHNKAIRTFIWILFLFELTLNFKSLFSLDPYLGLFLAWGVMNRDWEHEQIKNELIRRTVNKDDHSFSVGSRVQG